MNLSFTYSDATSEVGHIQISGDYGATWSDWERAVETKPFVAIKEGIQTVYVRGMDSAGNISIIGTDYIIIDLTAPEGTIEINDGKEFTNQNDVNLKLTGTDNELLEVYRLSNDGVIWGEWTAYPTEENEFNVDWNLGDNVENGEKTVYYQVRDEAGNISETSSDTINYDSTKLEGVIEINTGDNFTNSKSFNLSLGVLENEVQATGYRLSNDGLTWREWTTYPTENEFDLVWNLEDGIEDGEKTVYYQVRSTPENESEVVSDTIVYDTEIPSIAVEINDGDDYTNDRNVDLGFTYSDETSGVQSLQTSKDGLIWSDWFDPVTNKQLQTNIGKSVHTLPIANGNAEGEFIEGGNTNSERENYLAGDVCMFGIRQNDEIHRGQNGGIGIIENDGSDGSYYDGDTNTFLLRRRRNLNDIHLTTRKAFVIPEQYRNSDYSLRISYGLSKAYLGNGPEDLDFSLKVYDESIFENEVVCSGERTLPVYPENPIYEDTISMSEISKRSAIGGNVLRRFRSGNDYNRVSEVELTEEIEEIAFSLQSEGVSAGYAISIHYVKVEIVEKAENEIYVRARDNAGNISEISTDTIEYDDEAPEVSIEINNGDENTTDKNVTLGFTYSDAFNKCPRITNEFR